MNFFVVTAAIIIVASPFVGVRAGFANGVGEWSTMAKAPRQAAVQVQAPPPAHSGEVEEAWESTVQVGEVVAVGAAAAVAVSFLTPTTVVVAAAAAGGAAVIIASGSSSNSNVAHPASP
jgi:hypothetical protein